MSRVERILEGNVRAVGKLLRDIDDHDPAARRDLTALYPHTGNAYIIGITGNPGAGKSTLVDGLIAHFRRQNLTVGCIAVDPTSPFTGGAILADRVRMRQHYSDPGVFIRSVATRGALGGLSPSVWGMVHVFDAMGRDIIIVETVGVGQDEIDVVRLAHTSVVLTVPGLGDDMQALKAGILEIADIFVINKADRPGVKRVEKSLNMLLELEGPRKSGWTVPIVKTAAVDRSGIRELGGELQRHREHIAGPDVAAQRARRRVEAEVFAIATDLVHRLVEDRLEDGAELMNELVQRRRDPWSVAAELVAACVSEQAPES